MGNNTRMASPEIRENDAGKIKKRRIKIKIKMFPMYINIGTDAHTHMYMYIYPRLTLFPKSL